MAVNREAFDFDLKFGQARESEFVAAVSQCTVEHKSDRWARRTGKIAIEIRQGSTERGKGRPSGISTTLSKFYAVEFDDDRWLVIRTSLLKLIVRECMCHNKTVMIGDGARFENVLLSLPDMLGAKADVIEVQDFIIGYESAEPKA